MRGLPELGDRPEKGDMDVHEHFLQSLTAEEEQLIIIRDFLYDGDWDEVVQDLRSRQQGRPFIFKLNTRIDEDLKRIEKLQSYERVHGVNLGRLLVKSGKYPELSQSVIGDQKREREKDAENPATRA